MPSGHGRTSILGQDSDFLGMQGSYSSSRTDSVGIIQTDKPGVKQQRVEPENTIAHRGHAVS